MSDLDKISSIFNAKIDTVKSKDDLQNIKTEFFGKNGQITLQFKSLGSIDPEKRKEFASNLNKIKDDLTYQLEQKNIEIETNEINEKLKNEKVDVTLPIRPERQGKIHPVSQVIDEISSIFSEIGFSVAEGPDIETEYNNFTALNTPEEHPARDLCDKWNSFCLKLRVSCFLFLLGSINFILLNPLIRISSSIKSSSKLTSGLQLGTSTFIAL